MSKKNLFFSLVIVLGLLFTGCKKDETPGSNGTTSLTNSTLTGAIESYPSGAKDSLYAIVSDTATKVGFVGHTVLSATGSFSLPLESPSSNFLQKAEIDVAFVGTISDRTALISINPIQLIIIKNETPVYEIMRANFTTIENSSNVNAAYSIFVYSNKPLTVNGSSTLDFSDFGGALILTEKDNFTLKSGWNELVYKVETMTTTATSASITMTLTNNIPSDLKWRFFADNLMQNSPKQIGVRATQQKMNFRTPIIFGGRK
ncbi:MAG: hypothetical protein PHV20_12575 [Bacteroidales bacterium]|nr:hypothetical protein [Bacteroidales bacterium]